ncbi:MAG: hypothetical protein ABFR32_02285 [Bacteroidota bacterium]
MKLWLYILVVLNFFSVFAQNKHDEKINALIDQYTADHELKCEIIVKIEIEGMHIPDKKIYTEFKKDEKPIIKGEGLTLFPKKGTMNQFNELLSSPLQAIFLSKIKDNLVYKLVSLDQNSDWITADIIFNEQTNLIYESTVNTRKFGTFHTVNSYNDQIYPSKSTITFDIKKIKIPLKFVGREQSVSNYSDQNEDEEVKGKIILLYQYF